MRWLRTSRSKVKDILGKKSIQLIILDQGVLKLLQHFKNKGQLLLHDTHIRQNWKSTLDTTRTEFKDRMTHRPTFWRFFPRTWTMKYSQKLQPGWVRFSRSVRISSSKRPRFLVKDMRRRVRSFSSKEFQDSWDRDESFRGSDRTTHLDENEEDSIHKTA